MLNRISPGVFHGDILEPSSSNERPVSRRPVIAYWIQTTGNLGLSVTGAILVVMEVTASDIAGVPPNNVRVPREEFVAVWREAARRSGEHGQQGELDWYFGAVALTCRWIAAAPLRSSHGNDLARSPATRVPSLALEELIEAEYLAAQNLEQRRADLAARPGWCEGVRATLRWAWRREGPPPLELPAPAPRSSGYASVDASSLSGSSSTEWSS